MFLNDFLHKVFTLDTASLRLLYLDTVSRRYDEESTALMMQKTDTRTYCRSMSTTRPHSIS